MKKETINPLISVILPVYNVEKYILKCLETISNQTYKNIEVILVIDGSTDNSFNISKEYCQKDNRFYIIYQKNAGSGPARNNGINHASGEFIIFVDPDDWLTNDYIETLYNKYRERESDIIISSGIDIIYNKKNKRTKEVHKHIPELFLNSKVDVRSNYLMLFNLNMLSGPGQKLYKTDIIKKNNIEFPNLRRSQDIVFNYRYYNHISSLQSIDYQGYQYRLEKTSYITKLDKNYFQTISLIYNDIKKLHEEWEVNLNDKILSTICFASVCNYIESMITKNDKYTDIFNCSTVVSIINNATPQNIYQRLINLTLKKRLLFITNLIVKFKIIAKKIYY